MTNAARYKRHRWVLKVEMILPVTRTQLSDWSTKLPLSGLYTLAMQLYIQFTKLFLHANDQ